jgi:hypothetical protein
MFAISRIKPETGEIQYVGTASTPQRIVWKSLELQAKLFASQAAAEESGLYLPGLILDTRVEQLA